MHIGLCSPHWPPAKGANGIVSYVSAIRDHFLAEGHRVSIISGNHLYPDDSAPVALPAPSPAARLRRNVRWRIDRLLGRQPGALPDVGRELARDIAAAHRIRPLDIVEMEDSFGWSSIVQQKTGVPVVTRLHGPYFLKPLDDTDPAQLRANRERCNAEAHAVRAARMVTAPNGAVLSATCVESRRDPAKPSIVIANPIRIDPARPQWQIDTCEPDHILAVGRFEHIKGPDTLFAAFERLLETRPTARLTFVGPDIGIATGTGETIGFEAYVHANLSPRTRERIDYRGQLRPEEIAPLRLKANVTVISSRCEVFPYALLEGMAAGSPMISTDWPGSEDIIIHGETGLLTPVAQPEALAQAIERLLADPQETARMASAGHDRCATAFSVEVVGNQLLDCYAATLRAAV
ncbi:glycosyltransferase family 4 protein [Novosphingobium sp. BL-8A]|uniref:glycosyltransferase family 4 protein n=1 Tax=Novosphingobium sp. BL-8A TaxID=3127639 RepID=UPI003756DA2C